MLSMDTFKLTFYLFGLIVHTIQWLTSDASQFQAETLHLEKRVRNVDLCCPLVEESKSKA